jgi:peptidoglycan/xylan/chitin deacetylase (PgdA/CDA1 family)
VGYFLANLRVPAGRLRVEPRETDDLVISMALVAGAILVGYWVDPAMVTMAVSGCAALAGIHFPLVSVKNPSRYTAVGCSAVALAMLMPRAIGWGFILFGAVYLLTGRTMTSTVVSMFVVPWAAWFTHGSDLLVIFGAVAWMMLAYSALDQAECQVRQALGRPRANLILRKRLRRVLGILALASVFVLFFLNRYVYHGFRLHPQVFSRGSSQLNYVALTFDDGPHPRWTQEILDILGEKRVQATFFVVGQHVDRYPEVLRRILDEGHEVGSHTYFHTNLLNAGEATTLRELMLTEQALERVAGFSPKLFRPPRGLMNPVVLEAAHSRGYTTVLWSVSSTDWLGTPASRMVRELTARVSGGDIILFHDSGDFITAAGASRRNTVQAVGPLIDVLHDRGFKLVTISELMIMSLLLDGAPP